MTDDEAQVPKHLCLVFVKQAFLCGFYSNQKVAHASLDIYFLMHSELSDDHLY